MESFKVFLMTLALLACPSLAVYQDLTQVLDKDNISYYPNPLNRPFTYNIVISGPYAGNDTFVANHGYSMMEHTGTHIDAPYHFDINGLKMAEVSLDALIGPLVRIDITARVQEDSDTTVSVSDLQGWETKNGRIPEGAYVIMFSGWSEYWGDQIKYIGTDQIGGDMHYPGHSLEAVTWLLENRNIKGIGVDSMRCDAGNVDRPVVHEYLLPRQKICIENLRSLDKVPECGAKIYGLPIPMKNSTGAQGRVFAEWYPGVGYLTDCNGAFERGTDGFVTGAGTVLLASAYASLLAVICAKFL